MKRVLQVLVSTGLLMGAAVAVAPASHADPDNCAGFTSAYTGEQYFFCVTIGTVDSTSIPAKPIYGKAYTYSPFAGSAPLGTITVAVYQCDGYGHNCGVTASNRQIAASNVFTYSPYSPGHVYKTCGSYVGSGRSVGAICTDTYLPVFP